VRLYALLKAQTTIAQALGGSDEEVLETLIVKVSVCVCRFYAKLISVQLFLVVVFLSVFSDSFCFFVFVISRH
jgi:hypothetical protein